MVQALQAGEIDVGVGLTEGWVAAFGKAQASKDLPASDVGFKVIGTYVETPLCWAISTGPKREISGVEELNGKRIGVSRIGRYEFKSKSQSIKSKDVQALDFLRFGLQTL